MGNLATVTPIRPSLSVVERQVADLDDGYTRIANELLEAVMAADLTARQLKVVLAVIRKTYGFGKKLDRITNTQIAGITGIHHTHVCTAKNEMISMNILVSNGRQVGVNKVVSEWKTNISQDGKTLAKSANKTLAKSANGYSPTRLNTKETIQKKKENTPLPPEGEMAGQEENTGSKKNTAVDYQAVLSAYNSTLGDRLPKAEALNDKRRKAIKRLLGELKEPTVTAVTSYFAAFAAHAKPFYFGENNSGWRASFDYLLRSNTLLKTREGSL